MKFRAFSLVVLLAMLKGLAYSRLYSHYVHNH